jgi:hypothetical protein
MLRWLFNLVRHWTFGGAHAPGPRPPGHPRSGDWPPFLPLSLNRFDGPGSPPPLHWKACHPRTAHLFKSEMTCSHGHGIVLGGHDIRADGNVHPSVVCSTPGCSFHTFVKLAGWQA